MQGSCRNTAMGASVVLKQSQLSQRNRSALSISQTSAQQQLRWATVPEQSGDRCALSVGASGSPSNATSHGPKPASVPSGILIPDPSSRLATIDMGRKWGMLCPLLGEAGTELTQCDLGRGLSPYRVASCWIQLFGHNRHGPKIEGLCPHFLGELGPRLTQCGLG